MAGPALPALIEVLQQRFPDSSKTTLRKMLQSDRVRVNVHRLDRDTSGVLVFAKNTWVRDQLQQRFAAHDIERVYIAIVHGKLRERSGTFRSFLAEDRDLHVRSVAITHYRTVASGRRYSILEFRELSL